MNKWWTGALLGILTACGGGQNLPPLHVAARKDDAAAVTALLKAGADPNYRGRETNGWTPLMHAIHKRSSRAAIALIEAGADVNARGGAGVTALIMAAGYGETDVVRALLTAGADPRAATEDGIDAVWSAAGGGAIADITDGPPLGACFPDTVAALLERAPEMRLKKGLETRALSWLARSDECRRLLARLQPR